VLSFSLRSPLTEPPSVIDVAYWHKADKLRLTRISASESKADIAKAGVPNL
jgi:hypothetical protein